MAMVKTTVDLALRHHRILQQSREVWESRQAHNLETVGSNPTSAIDSGISFRRYSEDENPSPWVWTR